MPRDVVSFLSDYGLQDEFVGVCHGVMLKIAPHVTIIDVHHGIMRQDIRHGAIVLEQAIGYLPEGVHLAVVDPGVGSRRRAVAIQTASGQVFVGPDNGLLMAAVDRAGGPSVAVELTNERFLLSPISRTFQGRDVFAPSAAHIASGVELDDLGPEVDLEALIRLEIPEAWIHDDHLHAEVLQVDRFGNLQLDFDRTHLEKIGLSNGETVEVRLEGHRLNVLFANAFADVAGGEFVLIEDSYQHLSLAINNGDAAARLRARARSTAIVGPLNR